jgi:chaperone required for assembly of F1-ATPase
VSAGGIRAARRAYENVTVESRADGFAVRLDDKPLKTPGGRPVVVPWAGLAEAIAGEWRAPGAKPNVAGLSMTRIVATALDRIPSRRAGVLDELLAYAETELVCHRADGVLPRAQPEASLKALRHLLERLDDLSLAGLGVAVASSGSLVIGLAMLEKRLDAARAFDAAELDATFQIEQWGEDSIAAQRRAELRAELETAAKFIGFRQPA